MAPIVSGRSAVAAEVALKLAATFSTTSIFPRAFKRLSR
jgi:plasmid maintenance system antidote protein VapI